jgi:phosphoglycolate phosphatase
LLVQDPRPTPRITLAVLDMAGTTVRDAGTVEHAFWEALSAVGANPELHLDYLRATMGQPKIEVFRTILADDSRAHLANARFEDAYDSAVSRGDVEPLPGAETAFAALRAVDIRICLTTGFSRATQDHIVDVLGWRDLVDLALAPDPDDGLRGRPHPDLVLAAALHFRVDDVREIAVAGDTTNDLLAGAAAGASVVAGVLGGAHDASALQAAPHTHIVRSIDEFPAVVSGATYSSAGAR